MQLKTAIFGGLLATALAAPFVATPTLADSLWFGGTVQVPASGEIVTRTLPSGVWAMDAYGIYEWGGGYADGDCSTSFEDPTWVAERNGADQLDLQVKLPWTSFDGIGNGCDSEHHYHTFVTCYTPCTLQWRILDESPGDNAGSLTMQVTQLP